MSTKRGLDGKKDQNKKKRLKNYLTKETSGFKDSILKHLTKSPKTNYPIIPQRPQNPGNFILNTLQFSNDDSDESEASIQNDLDEIISPKNASQGNEKSNSFEQSNEGVVDENAIVSKTDEQNTIAELKDLLQKANDSNRQLNEMLELERRNCMHYRQKYDKLSGIHLKAVKAMRDHQIKINELEMKLNKCRNREKPNEPDAINIIVVEVEFTAKIVDAIE